MADTEDKEFHILVNKEKLCIVPKKTQGVYDVYIADLLLAVICKEIKGKSIKWASMTGLEQTLLNKIGAAITRSQRSRIS